MLDLTPTTHIIESYRNNLPNYRILCGEAVDNSFDAGATKVDIIIDRQKIQFFDNGIGVTNDRVKSLITLGSHAGMDSTKLGRYGIGIKEQAAAAGDGFSIFSRSRDGLMNININWRVLSESQTWEVTPPIWDMHDSAGETYTKIVISELRNIPKQSQLTRITAELERMFQPALMSGKTITLNGKLIDPIKDPKLSHVVVETIEVDAGKFATVRAGVLANAASAQLNQVHVSYEHRVIKAQDLFGCGDGIGAHLMFARVTLHGKWDLGKNKTEITDEHAGYLEERLEEVLEPILARCRKEKLSAVVTEAELAINQMLPSDMRPNRPNKTRTEPPRQGKKLGAKDAKSALNANDSHSGPTRGARNASKISFDLVPNLKDANGCDVHGQVKKNGRQIVVQIRSNLPSIKDLIERKLFSSLYLIGLQIYAEGVRRINSEFDFGDFGSHVFNLINMQQINHKDAA